MKTRIGGWIAAVLLAMVASACQKTDAAAPAKPVDERLARAEAMFAERCKKSGEFIHRTVEDVEAVLL